MNKAELIAYVADEVKGISKADASRAVDAVLAAIKKGLKQDKIVSLVGFGSLGVKERKARTGRNPQTGAEIKIKAAKVVFFRAGKQLKEEVNR